MRSCLCGSHKTFFCLYTLQNIKQFLFMYIYWPTYMHLTILWPSNWRTMVQKKTVNYPQQFVPYNAADCSKIKCLEISKAVDQSIILNILERN